MAERLATLLATQVARVPFPAHVLLLIVAEILAHVGRVLEVVETGLVEVDLLSDASAVLYHADKDQKKVNCSRIIGKMIDPWKKFQ
jgi:hypothetical protein